MRLDDCVGNLGQMETGNASMILSGNSSRDLVISRIRIPDPVRSQSQWQIWKLW